MVKVLFFASLREALGVGQLNQPLNCGESVADLVAALQSRDDVWQRALAGTLLCSVNQEIVPLDTQISAGDEVALFPPVTGG
ncbi:molybdopterin synthase sulfur carrier subunit [Amphritea opalescens]|uniref:Molybdopterin synthase sulfur carrier subunit n=1 Tax=Amphritea opalescens TaxID=2490544 RepID=A0A430KP96_9GAMM|nr:MoaD/ThiS family protein [Amphritea opalescens]RTE65214.1 molybdopterin synthase sulfur carrier subunit [Amphritea opalescens]